MDFLLGEDFAPYCQSCWKVLNTVLTVGSIVVNGFAQQTTVNRNFLQKGNSPKGGEKGQLCF